MTAVIKSLVPGAAMLMLAVSAHAGFYIEGSPRYQQSGPAWAAISHTSWR